MLFKTRGKLAIPALMLPVIVLGGIYGGIMNNHEASAMAVIYAIPVGVLVYKVMKLAGSHRSARGIGSHDGGHTWQCSSRSPC